MPSDTVACWAQVVGAEFGYLLDALALALPAIAIVLLISTAVSVLAFIPTAFIQKQTGRQTVFVLVLLFCLSLVGAAAGYSGGLSRSAVVGDIVPAILALIGGVVLYIFGVAQSKTLLPAFGVIALICALILGYSTGSNFRGQIDRAQAGQVDKSNHKAELCANFAVAVLGSINRPGAVDGEAELARETIAAVQRVCAD